jgi:hypothetical protein
MANAGVVKKRSSTQAVSPAGKWVVELRLPGDPEWKILGTQRSQSRPGSGREPRLWRYDRAFSLARAIEQGFPGATARVVLPPGIGETWHLFLLPEGGMPGGAGTGARRS